MMPNFNLANLGAMRNMEARPVSAPGMWGGQQAPGPYPVSPIATPHPAGPNLGMLGALGGQPQHPYPMQPMGSMPAPIHVQPPMMHPPSYPGMGGGMPAQGGMPGGFGGYGMPQPVGPAQGGMGGGMNFENLRNLLALGQMRGGMGY